MPTRTRRHLLGLEGMAREDIEKFFERAIIHRQSLREKKASSVLSGHIIANTFFEDSTRTRSSFEIAAKMLGAEVLNWSSKGSSVSKGESLLDTIRNIDAMRPSAIVIRHSSSGAAEFCARHVQCSVINAGDGLHEHPSQGLLDAFTLLDAWGSLSGRTVAIVGDILHSRVARSNIFGLQTLGAKVWVCGPPTLVPAQIETLGCKVSFNLDELLPEVDAVMTLRIQAERQSDSFLPSAKEYSRLFGLNAARVQKMRKEALVLHPGPVNRGVELSSDVADGGRSVILKQVENGVAIRMAILEACA